VSSSSNQSDGSSSSSSLSSVPPPQRCSALGNAIAGRESSISRSGGGSEGGGQVGEARGALLIGTTACAHCVVCRLLCLCFSFGLGFGFYKTFKYERAFRSFATKG